MNIPGPSAHNQFLHRQDTSGWLLIFNKRPIIILVGTVSRYVGDQEKSSDRISSILEIIQTSQKDCSIKDGEICKSHNMCSYHLIYIQYITEQKYEMTST